MSNFDRSRYVVVFFDFSAICKAIETLEQRFEEYCHRHIENAMERNPDLFPLRSSRTTAASKSGDLKSPAGRDVADAKADSLRFAEAMVSRTAVCDASSEATMSNGVRAGGKVLRCPFESSGAADTTCAIRSGFPTDVSILHPGCRGNLRALEAAERGWIRPVPKRVATPWNPT